MKTATLFFALLLAVSTTALGNDKTGLTIVSSRGSEVFKVIYKGTATGKVKLNVRDVRGNVIHTETILGLDGFICPVNFKGLTPGQYTIEVVDKTARYQELVIYKPASEYKSIHVSKLQSEDGKYLLAVANTIEEPIRVTIYDQERRVVYDESQTRNGDFAQVFKLPGYGRFTFEISDNSGNNKYFNF